MWRGVLIEESLQDKALLSKVRIVRTAASRLEREEQRGEFHFHNVEVDDASFDALVKGAMDGLKKGWYLHLVRDDTITVCFTGKMFKARKGDTAQLERIREYGTRLGIAREQMSFERLLEKPYDD